MCVLTFIAVRFHDHQFLLWSSNVKSFNARRIMKIIVEILYKKVEILPLSISIKVFEIVNFATSPACETPDLYLPIYASNKMLLVSCDKKETTWLNPHFEININQSFFLCFKLACLVRGITCEANADILP